jgi:hypothetical protein
MRQHKGLFSKDNQPSPEARAESGKTRSIKLRVSHVLSQMTVGNVLSPAEIKKMYPAYKNWYATIDDFKAAYAAEIMAYNIFRHVLRYDEEESAENTLKVLKHLDVMSRDDLKETLNPIFHFDKYESEI